MPSPPPGDNDERGSEQSAEARIEGAARKREPLQTVNVEEPNAKTTAWLDRATANDPAADVALFEAEAAASMPASPRRAAPLVHEAAHLRERALGNVREAARSYTQSLTLDPSFGPNAWALRRVFARRGLWDNLVRVLDAEIRFGVWPRPADCADLRVERGRVLEDRLHRDSEAVESYLAALASVPDHPGALWALLLHGWRAGDGAQTDTALSGLLRQTSEPGGRALLALALGRLQRAGEPAPNPEALARAAETLLRALSMGAEPGPLLRELDRLSLLSDRLDLRLRFLDAYESRVAREVLKQAAAGQVARQDPRRAAVVSHQREKARILVRRGARDAALAVLERTLRLAPAHPIALLDFLDAADEAGRADEIAAMLDGPLADLPPELQAQALLRRAEIAEKTGALGEAIGTLDRIPESSPLAPLAGLVRLRVLARLQDADGLARTLATVAERLATGGEADPREAAHLLVRAATARARVTEQTTDSASNAEALLRRALALVPGYGPATLGLAATLAHAQRFAELATFIESQAETTGGTPSRPLRESVIRLYRDILVDGAAALPHQRALLAEHEDARTHLRLADLAGLDARAGASAAGRDEAVRSLEWLTERSSTGQVAASLRLLTARLLGPDDRTRTEALLRQAFAADPASLAGATLESLIDEGEGRTAVISDELRAAEAAGRIDVARALRYRLAFRAARAGAVGEALIVLQPLRRDRDALAEAWSLELVRQARQGQGEIGLLRELGEHHPEPTAVDGHKVDGGVANERSSVFERTWALAEALESAGDRPAALTTFQQAATQAPQADPARRVDVELGLFRCHMAEHNLPEALASLRRLATSLEDPACASVEREAALLSLSAGLPADEAGKDGPSDGVWHWLRGVRRSDPHEVVRGLEQMAQHADPGPASAWLWTAAGMNRAFLGDAGAPAALDRAALALAAAGEKDGTREIEAALAVATTDIAPREALTPPLRALRRARADRLARGSEAQRRLAEELLLEEGLDAETRGSLDTASASYAAVLTLRPDSLEATEALRRIAQATGDRRGQAAALARRGALSHSKRRAAEAYAEAALLLEEEGLDAEAAHLFLKVLAYTPADDEAYRRLHQILSRREDADGIERLLTFKLQQTTDAEARVRLLLERARVRLDGTGNRKGAVEDWKRILMLDPHHADSLRTLGRLAMEDRRFAAAAKFFDRALARESEGDAQAALRLLLAEAYEGAGDLARAIEVLTAAAEAHPDASEPRERLVALAIRQRNHDLALAQLAALESRAPDQPGRAAVLIRIGRLERDLRHDPQRALAAFRSALVFDPLSEAAAELTTLVPGGWTPDDEDRAAIDGVVSQLRRWLLVEDPLDARRLERLHQVARLRGLGDLAEVAGQLLGAVGLPGERAKARELTRPLSPGTLRALMEEEDAPRVRLVTELWPLLAEAAARAEGLDLAQLGAGRQTRVPPGSDPRLRWLEAAAQSLGLTPVIHVSPLDNLSVVALDAPEPSLVIGRGVLGGDPASRFRAGRALFLLHLRAATAERLPMAQLDEILWGAVALSGAHPSGVDAAALKARAKALGKGMARRDLKTLETYRARLEAETLTAVAWRTAVVRGADRFGLLVSGEAGACVRVLAARGEGASDPRRPECLELIRFALDDRYTNLRREAGIAAGES